MAFPTTAATPVATAPASEPDPRAIRVLGATKAYGPSLVLDAVDLDIAQGQFVSVIGASGCGKTTLLRCIAGLEGLTDGRIRVGGRPRTAPGGDCVYVFQDYGRSLFPWRTLERNVSFPLEARLGRRKAVEEAQRWIALVGLDGAQRKHPWQMSGGMQQRAAIARALAAKPSVLLMDEPFAAVDAQTRMQLQSTLLEIHAALRITVLFVTHDVDEAVYLADRVVVLSPQTHGIVDDVQVALPRPRSQRATRASAEFLAHRSRLLGHLGMDA